MSTKKRRSQTIQDTCPPKPALAKRPLLTIEESSELKKVFRILANETRLRMLHALVRAGELCVNELAEAVEMKPQAISNQLQRLVDRRIVASRRNGNNIHYRIIDPCVTALLHTGLCLIEDAQRNVRTYSIHLPAI